MATPDPGHGLAAAVHVVACHWARPDTIDEVRQILIELVAPSRAEPGCLKYELFQNLSDPGPWQLPDELARGARA